MKTKIKFWMLSAGLGLFIMNGCKKDSTDDIDANSDVPVNIEKSESITDDAEDMSDQAANLRIGNTGGQTAQDLFAACASVSYDTVSVPHVMTVDFGSVNCLCKDGRYRRGQVIITYSGNYFDTGSSHTITFNNYYVNDNHVEGTRTVTNNGPNGSGHYTWTIQATNMTVTHPDGTVRTWNSTRTREMIAGYGTATCWDDVYLITGSFSGTDTKGRAFIANITSALRKEVGCHWIVSGTIQITKVDKADKTLDFGNGNCDDQATVTVNGNVKNITLH